MYNKTIAKFTEDCKDPKSIEKLVERLRQEVPRTEDAKSEEDSWSNSLPLLADILNLLPEHVKKSVEVVLEKGYPCGERADVILVGKKGQATVMVIIENKQWSNLQRYSPIDEEWVVDPIPDHKPFVEHPCCQVARYKYVLDNENGYVQDNKVSIHTAVFMHNATKEELFGHIGPFNEMYQEKIAENPVFVGKEGETSSLGKTLLKYIEEIMDCGEPGMAEDIYESPVKYSEKYKKDIGNLFGSREKLLKMLDGKQKEIFKEIETSVCSRLNEKTVYIVEGDPGTGKTFVAMALLSYLYSSPDHNTDYVVKLLLKNRDPRKALKRKGAPAGAITYGLDGDKTHYNCLICDESHRMREEVWKGKDDRNHIEAIIRQSDVAVFFYDRKQRVHVNDYMTPIRIRDIARKLKVSEKRIIREKLIYQHRCLDSDHFISLIDRILYRPDKGLKGIEKFTEDETYKVRLVNSPRELFYKISEVNAARDKRANGSRVLAGKGSTDGVDWEWKNDNESLDSRKTVGPFRNSKEKYVWNLHEYLGKDSFASHDESVNLVGCVDTSQGLDFEYIGLIFSPDIKVKERHGVDRVVIDLSGHQKKDPNLTDYKSCDQALKTYGYKLLVTIIRNTYRVLASRGEKGCFIYCCDKNLQDYLGTIIPTLKVSVPNDYVVYPERAAVSQNRNNNNNQGRVLGTISKVRKKADKRDTAEITGLDGTTYGVNAYNYKAAGKPPEGSDVSFVVWTNSKDEKFANDIKLVTK